MESQKLVDSIRRQMFADAGQHFNAAIESKMRAALTREYKSTADQWLAMKTPSTPQK